MFKKPRYAAVLELHTAARSDADLRDQLAPIAARHQDNVNELARRYFPAVAGRDDFAATLQLLLDAMQGMAIVALSARRASRRSAPLATGCARAAPRSPRAATPRRRARMANGSRPDPFMQFPHSSILMVVEGRLRRGRVFAATNRRDTFASLAMGIGNARARSRHEGRAPGAAHRGGAAWRCSSCAAPGGNGLLLLDRRRLLLLLVSPVCPTRCAFCGRRTSTTTRASATISRRRCGNRGRPRSPSCSSTGRWRCSASTRPRSSSPSPINTLYQFWIHTELIDRLGPLEWILNTPSHHRVHHGANVEYLDRNHAGILIVWDTFFGTFEPEDAPVATG